MFYCTIISDSGEAVLVLVLGQRLDAMASRMETDLMLIS